MSQIEDEIVNELEEKFSRHPIWIWYDSRKKFEGILDDIEPKLKEQDIELLEYDGSYLELKHKIWKEDPDYNQRWLLYVSEHRKDAEWLKDIHRIGKEYRPSTKLTDNPGSKYLVERTEKIPDQYIETWASNDEFLEKAFFCVLFKEDHFNPRDFVIDYLKNPNQKLKIIKRYEQDDAWEDLLEEEYGIVSGLDASELAKQIFFSEVHENSPVNKYEKIAADMSKKVAELCEYWQRHHQDSYMRYIDSVIEEHPDIKETVIESGSLKWGSIAFKEIDEGLLELCLDRINQPENLDVENLKSEIIPLIEDRKNTFWYRNDFTEFWDVLDHGLKAAIKSAEASENVSEESTIEQLISFYQKDGWKVDKEYRKYVESKNQLLETYEKLEEAGERITDIYMRFLKYLNRIFTEKVTEGKTVGRSQIDYWKEHRPKEGTALIICDGMRYELARDLQDRLKNKSEIKGDVEILSGTIPTITETGMAAHLGKELTYDLNGELTLSADGETIKVKSDRVDILEKEGLTVSDLPNLLNRPTKELRDEGKPPRVIFSQFIDQMGETLDSDDQVLSQVSKHVTDVEKAFRKLRSIGYNKFYITSDHGFIYTEKLLEELKVDPPECDMIKRRFVVNKSPIREEDPYLTIPRETFKKLKVNFDDLYFAFPRGLACFKAKGGNVRYLHGGISLQELVVPSLVLETESIEKEPKKVKLEVDFPSKITNSIITVNISPKGQVPLGGGQKIILQARKDDRIVSEQKEVEVQGKESVSLQLKMASLSEVDSVLLEALDPDTQEIIKSERTQIDLIIKDDVGFDIE